MRVNQIPNKYPSHKEIKCVDACTIDVKIEQTMLKQQNLQPIINVIPQKIPLFHLFCPLKSLNKKIFTQNIKAFKSFTKKSLKVVANFENHRNS